MTTATKAEPRVKTQVQFDYMTTRVKDLQVKTVKKGDRDVAETIICDGREMEITPRFWTSFFAKWGIGPSTFKYYSYPETFERISQREANDKIRLCVEKKAGKPERLLAMSSPQNIIVPHNELINLLGDVGIDIENADYGEQFPASGGSIDPRGIRLGHIGGSQIGTDGAMMPLPKIPDLTYDTGIVRSIHSPRNGGTFKIAGDEFSNRFVMDTPVDGYGKPAIFLMLLRSICVNGSIGYSRVFKSEISIGKKEDSFDYALRRAFEGYNNEDGFLCLRQRYETAANSHASINDVNKAYKKLVAIHHTGELRLNEKFLATEGSSIDEDLILETSPIIKSYHALVGDLTQAYGLANLDALPVKRQANLPTGCTVYELLNFLSEVATHHATPAGARQLQAHIGDILSQECYDLQDTKKEFSDWKSFLVLDAAAAESYAMAQGQKTN